MRAQLLPHAPLEGRRLDVEGQVDPAAAPGEVGEDRAHPRGEGARRRGARAAAGYSSRSSRSSRRVVVGHVDGGDALRSWRRRAAGRAASPRSCRRGPSLLLRAGRLPASFPGPAWRARGRGSPTRSRPRGPLPPRPRRRAGRVAAGRGASASAYCFGDRPTARLNARCRWCGPTPAPAASRASDGGRSGDASIIRQRRRTQAGSRRLGRRAGGSGGRRGSPRPRPRRARRRTPRAARSGRRAGQEGRQ